MLFNIKLVVSTFSAIVELLPTIIIAIKEIESQFPEGGKGQEKLMLVKAILQSIDSGVDEIWPTLQKAISAVVTFCNNTGVFTKST